MLQNSQEVVFRLSAPKCYHSTLLKEKYNYDPNIIIFTPTPPGDNKNRKYYKENHVLNQLLKWREMKNKKFLYALETGFTNYILWNVDRLRYISLQNCLKILCKTGRLDIIKLIIEKKPPTKMILKPTNGPKNSLQERLR